MAGLCLRVADPCAGKAGEDYLKSYQGGGTAVGVQASFEGALWIPPEVMAVT